MAVRDGLLGVRGPTLASGRLTPDGLRPITDAEGWLWTNDLGAVDDGIVSVVGRADDMVITGGVNVNPASVEVVLTDHPAIAGAGVVGVDDPEWGQRLVAAVVLRTPSTRAVPGPLEPDLAAALRTAVRTALGAPAAPRTFIVVDHLPLTSLGKVARHDLAARVASHIHDRQEQP